VSGYRFIIFDADQTLIDFFEDERRAFRAAFKATGKIAEEKDIVALRKFSDENWVELGLTEVHSLHVQKNFHALYERHIRDVANECVVRYGRPRTHTDEVFFEELCRPAATLAGALEVAATLAKRYQLSVATNGIAKMQRGRLASFAPYIEKFFISEEIGAIKPDEAFFSAVLDGLGAKREECLMVGDSLAADIAGANAVGIDSVFFNRTGMQKSSAATYTIFSLSELLQIL